jgi:competence protein ComEA
MVTANQGGPIKVDVAGAVARPDVYELERGSRVHEAIEAAGGFTEDADTGALNRATVLHDGDRLYVPTKEVAGPDASPSDTAAPSPDPAALPPDQAGQPSDTTGTTGGSTDAPTGLPVNINTADSETLQTLKNIGPITAQKIIDYRNSNGPFAQIEDIKNVEGIGEKTFEKLKDHIRV